MRITLLAGGIGGSKLAEGFARLCDPADLTIIGNIGDDIEQHGLWISPDLDIMTYTLAGIVDRDKGWGIAGDTFHLLEALTRLGEDTWMALGDRDLATHVYRTRRRREGARPTEIAGEIARRLGVSIPILPPSDEPIQTFVRTPTGWIHFEEFYIREQGRAEVLDIEYRGAEIAQATPEALEAVRRADLIVLAPSNPVASIGPILAARGLRETLEAAYAPRVAVSPFLGGRTLKGPADVMLRARGFEPTAAGLASFYEQMIDLLLVDPSDAEQAFATPGIEVNALPIVMHDSEDRLRLARDLIGLAGAPGA